MENRCVVCGDIIPEGRQVCPNCLVREFAKKIKGYYSTIKTNIVPATVVGYVEQIEREMLEVKDEQKT